MKFGFYFFHRIGVWTRAYSQQGGRRAIFRAMAIAFVLASLHELAYRTVFAGAPEWVGNVSTILMAMLAAGLTAYLVLVAYRHMVRQQDDEVAARERMHRELVEERNLLHAMMANTQDFIYFKDRESRFLRINEAMARSFGLKSASEAVGKTDFDLFPRELAAQKFDDEQRIIASGSPILAREERGQVVNGKQSWMSTSKMPLRDRHGAVVGTFGISRDVTERKKADEKFRGLLESSPEAMVIVNPQGLIVLVNSQTERLFGYAREEMLGRPVEMLIPAPLREGHVSKRRGYLMDPRQRPMGVGLELLAHRKDGGEFPVEVGLSPLETEEGILITSSIRDVTERKREEQRRQAVSTGLQKILEIADELIACEDEEALFLHAVEFARSKLGLERCAIFIDAGEDVRGTFGTSLDGTTTDERNHRFPRSELWSERMRLRGPGEKRWNISDETYHEWRENFMADAGRGPVAVTPIQSSRLDVIGIFCNDNAISQKELDPAGQEVVAVYCSLLGNIVARKRAERAQLAVSQQQRLVMERTDRLNAVGMLAAGMAHEINNPLQGMLSHLRALQPFVPPDSSGRRSLDMVQTGIDTIASLVRRLLMLGSSGESGRDGGADVREAVEFVAQLLESQFRRTNVRIEGQFSQHGLRVAMARAEFIQILMNLLINARDAMPDGGIVRIEVSDGGGVARLVVSDTGQGIPTAVLGRIFAPFFTTKGSKGTGLGLSVTESLVRAARGSIGVESTPGKGATFTVTLPLFQGERK